MSLFRTVVKILLVLSLLAIRQIVSVIYQACTRGVVTAKEGVCLRYSGLFFFSGFYRG